MSVSAIFFLSANSLLLLVILAVVTGIILKQKKGALRNEDAIKGCNAILDEQKEQISRVLQGSGSILELVKKGSETTDQVMHEITRQTQLLQDIKKEVEAIKPNYTSERIEGFCGQIMNRVISLEEKIYDLKRINEQLATDYQSQKIVSSAPSSGIKSQAEPPPPADRTPPCKGNLISDLVKTIDPGDHATPAEKKKYKLQVEIINKVDEVLKISDMKTAPDFTLTLDTNWMAELGFSYEQIAQVDSVLSKLFECCADSFFSQESVFWYFARARGVTDLAYIPCFKRVFNYCIDKDYFNRVTRKL